MTMRFTRNSAATSRRQRLNLRGDFGVRRAFLSAKGGGHGSQAPEELHADSRVGVSAPLIKARRSSGRFSSLLNSATKAMRGRG